VRVPRPRLKLYRKPLRPNWTGLNWRSGVRFPYYYWPLRRTRRPPGHSVLAICRSTGVTTSRNSGFGERPLQSRVHGKSRGSLPRDLDGHFAVRDSGRQCSPAHPKSEYPRGTCNLPVIREARDIRRHAWGRTAKSGQIYCHSRFGDFTPGPTAATCTVAMAHSARCRSPLAYPYRY